MTELILENELINRLVRGMPRSQRQLNTLHESDAELMQLPIGDVVLAITTDAIVEEIQTGLYDDPYLIGWMTVMVNASDLAAVGAEPVGLLLNETLPPDTSDRYLSDLQRGIADACHAVGLSVIGGDTNSASELHLSASAIGLIREGSPITRRGCQPGDRLYASGTLGLGSAFAFVKLHGGATLSDVSYRPKARLGEGQIVRRLGSCCMDTSDGAVATFDQLMRVNQCGFSLDSAVENLLHPQAIAIAVTAGLPLWTMLAGPHGEFELIFAVPDGRCEEFEHVSAAEGWQPVAIGRVVNEPGLRLYVDEQDVLLDTGQVRNLFVQVQGDVGAYVRGLLALHPKVTAL